MLSSHPKSYPIRTQPLERLAVYYTLPADDLIASAKPSANRLNSLLSNFEYPYSEITPRVYLGALPTYTLPKNVNMVASISTYEELACFKLPHHVRHLFLHIPDRTAIVTVEDAHDLVLQMYQFLQAHPDNVVLIHCKQGHSRSMMMCAALLMADPTLHDLPSDLSLKEACDFIQTKRRWTHVEDDKFNKAKDIVELINQAEKSSASSTVTYPDTFAFFSSLDGKDAIRRMREFMQFVAFVTRIKPQSPMLAGVVQDFLDDILFSEDGQWYQRLLDGKHSIQLHIRSGSELEECFNQLLTALRDLSTLNFVASNESLPSPVFGSSKHY